MAEFAGNYGFLPKHDDSWHLFLSLVGNSSRFWSRRQLVIFEGVADGISSMFAGDPQVSAGIRSELESLAWPTSRKTRSPQVIQNALAPTTSEGDSSA